MKGRTGSIQNSNYKKEIDNKQIWCKSNS